jgi:hypothetical protein
MERDRKVTDRRERLEVVREKRMKKDEMKDEVSRTETEGDKIWKERKGKRDRVIRERKDTEGKEAKENEKYRFGKAMTAY